jgi:hypothetical protein
MATIHDGGANDAVSSTTTMAILDTTVLKDWILEAGKFLHILLLQRCRSKVCDIVCTLEVSAK